MESKPKQAAKDSVTIPNRHADAVPKEVAQAITRGDYMSYFENEHGEQWIFTRARDADTGYVFGGDLGWDVVEVRERTREQLREELIASGSRPGTMERFETIIDPLAPNVILNDHERTWLNVAWETSGTWHEGREERLRQLGQRLGVAANAIALAKHPNTTDYRAAMHEVMFNIGLEAGRRGLSQSDITILLKATIQSLPRGE